MSVTNIKEYTANQFEAYRWKATAETYEAVYKKLNEVFNDLTDEQQIGIMYLLPLTNAMDEIKGLADSSWLNKRKLEKGE